MLFREKFRRYVTRDQVRDYLETLRQEGTFVRDPKGSAPITCSDPEDEYLLALAYSQKAILVSSDSDLLEIASGAPICAPRDFLAGSY